MIDTPRMLALISSFARRQSAEGKDFHPENFAILPYLIIDEMTYIGYCIKSETGFVLGSNNEQTLKLRNELIDEARKEHNT